MTKSSLADRRYSVNPELYTCLQYCYLLYEALYRAQRMNAFTRCPSQNPEEICSVMMRLPANR